MSNINYRQLGNITVKSGAILAIVFATLVSSQAMARIDKSTEAKLVKICHALKSDSRIRLHRTIKQSRLGYKQIATGLKCNGKSAVEFALFNNANKTADLLVRKAHIKEDQMLAKR